MKRAIAALALGLVLAGCAQSRPSGSTQSPPEPTDERRSTDFKSGTY